MIVEIRDRDALLSISIVGLRAYLKSRGWTDAGIWGERPITIFAKEHDGRTWEVLVPNRDTIGGYAENMADAVAVLAVVEERSQLDVFHDLKGAGADVIRIRSANGLAKEPLSLGQSATLLNDTYRMLAASARCGETPGSLQGQGQRQCGEFPEQSPTSAWSSGLRANAAFSGTSGDWRSD